VCCHNLSYSPLGGFFACESLSLVPNEAGLSQSYSVTQPFKFRQALLKGVGSKPPSFIAKEVEATLEVEISEGLFKCLDPEKDPYIFEFLMKTHLRSLKTVLVINLENSFEALLVDTHDKNLQTNLRRKMDKELLTSTRGAHVFAVEVN